MTAIYFFASVTAALLSSKLIDFLYSLPNAPLSFPDKIFGKHIKRKIFMTAILFAALITCAKLPTLQAAYLLTATFFLLLITVTDFEQYIIFDKILMPFALTGGIFVVILELPIMEHLISAIIGGGTFFAIMILSKGGIGGGDVKLVAVLGLWLGKNLSVVALIAAILGGVAAGILLATGLKGRKDFFAYGPYLCIATAAYLYFFETGVA